MNYIIEYTNSGNPIVALRIATHGFNYKEDSTSPNEKYRFMDETFEGGYGEHQEESTRGIIANGMSSPGIG